MLQTLGVRGMAAAWSHVLGMCMVGQGVHLGKAVCAGWAWVAGWQGP